MIKRINFLVTIKRRKSIEEEEKLSLFAAIIEIIKEGK